MYHTNQILSKVSVYMLKHSILALTALPILKLWATADGVGLGSFVSRDLIEKSIPENAKYIRK